MQRKETSRTASIYRMFLARPREPWYRRSAEQQRSLLGTVTVTLDDIGGTRVMLCDSSWAAEEWPVFGVEQHPDLAALQKHEALLVQPHRPLHLEAHTLVGTEWQPAT
jgi:hypothetical protein